MANFNLSFVLLSFFVLLLVSFNSGTSMAQVVPAGTKSWCVAKPSASEAELKNNINYVCNQLGYYQCNMIQEGGPCFSPNTLINHASIVMNIYFQKNGRTASTCSFTSSGLMVLSDPSYGSCSYPFY
ncbi:major pollen allergen Ole e 10-like [Silene latifolia]|uniref:major pollen allergen Ole e 10-like n=1 Tax=Silene latifolia TaxID=37657 RepID=UPI003D788870